MSVSPALDPKQLVWRCRRGVRELDVLFDRFLNSEFTKLDNQQRQAFEKLLDIQDPIIMDWLLSKSEPEQPDLVNIIEILQKISGLDNK